MLQSLAETMGTHTQVRWQVLQRWRHFTNSKWQK